MKWLAYQPNLCWRTGFLKRNEPQDHTPRSHCLILRQFVQRSQWANSSSGITDSRKGHSRISFPARLGGNCELSIMAAIPSLNGSAES